MIWINKKNIFPLLAISVFFFTIFTIKVSKPVFADAGGGWGSGGSSCFHKQYNPSRGESFNSISWCTSRVATNVGGFSWRYYPLRENEIVSLPGDNGGTYASATIDGCGKFGGYWRYAFDVYNVTYVRMTDDEAKAANLEEPASGKVWYEATNFSSAGRQVDGVNAISGNSSSVYNSEKLDGYGRYNSSYASWDSVADVFAAAQQYDANHGTTEATNGYSWAAGSKLGWFCWTETAEPPAIASYYTQSNIAIRDTPTATSSIADYKTTGIVTSGTVSFDQPYELEVGDTAYITFSHDIYSSVSESSKVSWNIDRTGFTGTGYNQLSTSATSSQSCNFGNTCKSGSTATTTAGGSGKFVADTRPYTDGNNNYVYRDFYKFEFTKAGTYRFCESIAAGGAKTTACSTIVVKEKDIPPTNCPVPGYTDTTLSATKDFGTTTGASGVKKTTSSIYSTGVIFLKPGDAFEFAHCYFPGATYVRGANEFSITSNNISKAGIPGVEPAFKNNGPGSFSVSGAKLTGTPGDPTGTIVVTNNTLKVKQKHAGEYGYQYISSNYWGTNSSTSNTKYGESNHVGVYIPYNYNASINVDPQTSTPSGVVYPGQEYKTEVAIHITPRNNTRTNGNYATETPRVEARLISFYLNPGTSGIGKVSGSSSTNSDPCSHYSGMFGGNLHDCSTKKSEYAKWNSTGNTDGSDDSALNTSFAVEDFEAGTIFCVAAGIHSASSGDDTGSGITDTTWAISPATCYTIAKKPNFHVYGGSTFSNGGIKTSITEKFKTSPSKVFGSLDEFAIIGSKSIITTNAGMASGNTLNNDGYRGTSASTIEDPKVLCGLSPLSIANDKCNKANGGKVGYSNIALDNAMINRLLARFTLTSAEDNIVRNLNNVNLSDYTLSNNTVRAYRYVYLSGNSTIKTAPTVGKGVTYIIYATGNVTIDTNLIYADSDEYTSVADIPQTIIMTTGNVSISEKVTRLDAWIIAPNGTIDTCYEYKTNGGTNDNSKNGELVNISNRCNQQLRINGPVVAKNLKLKRTYGAGRGSASSTPAEIINLSASTYIWAYSQARDYPQAFTTYLRELAPRY